ncbi:DUF4198 domain-containing protein [Sphingomonas sp. PB4P5]|uniref:DUF4198 domain-containing protein n=1 Tax=Parasphingomonas puruogangriensis TaxID=3096155 RepID=UPI002FC6A85A
MTMMKSRFALGCAALIGATTAASAHMPYVLPTAFDVGTRDHVTVQSAFGEDAFEPDVAMRDAPFALQLPDGSAGQIGPITYLRDLSIFEAELKAPGTYRITTGQRLGRMGQMFKVGTAWVLRGEDGNPPADATPVAVQSTTLAEAYVTRGKPTNAALAPRGQALEIHAVTHPSDITSGSAANFVLLFDGKPLAGSDVTLFRAAGAHDGRKVAAQTKSDAAGRFALTPDDAGQYLILVRHRTTAPAGAATPYRSYTYTLAFDAA